MKKLLSMALVLALALSCLLAASADEATVSYPLDGSNEPLTVLMSAETRALTVGYSSWGDTAYTNAWREKSGINVEFKEVADDPALILTLSAGEYPDVVMMYESTYNGGLTALIEDELAINLLDYADYMPDFLNVINSEEEYRRYVTHDDGGIYFFANLISADNVVTHWRGMVLRQDFLDKLNMAVPQTNEEFYNMLVAFRDELGCDVPLCCNWWGNMFNDGFFSTEYGLPSSTGYQVDGVYHYGAYEEGYRGTLGYMNRLYTEGLFDPNFQTTDEATSQACLLAGETGAHFTSCARINTISNRAEDPDFKLVACASLNGSDGTHAFFSQTDNLTPTRSNAYITADSKQPELAVELFNWLYTDEGILYSNFGPEGKCYTTTEDGAHVLTDYMTANESGLSLDQMLYVESMANKPCLVINELSLQRFAMQEQRDALKIWDDCEARTYLLPSYSIIDPDESTEYTNLWNDISTYINENRVKFITGDLNLGDDFDNYIAQLKKMGMDRCIEIQQKALDAYFAN